MQYEQKISIPYTYSFYAKKKHGKCYGKIGFIKKNGLYFLKLTFSMKLLYTHTCVFELNNMNEHHIDCSYKDQTV